ncbi:MAG: hypothetical protein ACI898_002100 [Flavobacteriales bacterium]
MKLKTLPLFFSLLILALTSCKKDEETVFENNTIPDYNEVPTILVQNYVNRLFIDLIGREPVDVEMDNEVGYLEENDLSEAARQTLVDKLMYDETFLAGDSSYNFAYFQRIYDSAKARMIDGASENIILESYNLAFGQAYSDSVNGNFTSYEINKTVYEKLRAVLDSKEELRTQEITIDEMFRRLINNSIYDQINMNSFNFVNASFDDLFYRYPTASEFDNAYQIIDANQAGLLFGQVAQNKAEYVQILTTTTEYHEGMINWAYLSLLSREPSSNEVFTVIGDFQNDLTFSAVQRSILIKDEYAGFN